MQRYLRVVLLIIGVICVLLTLGFAFQLSWATNLWFWPDSRLSYIFLGSIFAAISAPVLWIAYSLELGAVPGGALNIATIGIGGGVYMLRLFISRSDGQLFAGALVLFAIAIASAALYFTCRSIPIRDRRPVPLPVRAAFGLFAAVLIAVSLALVRRAAHVFPWPLRGESSVIIGFIFLGAALYFLYGLASEFWGEATGQLLGFLAYDLVLIVPFTRHFNRVLPAHRLSLTLYVIVLVASGALAVYYLFLAPSTRFGGSSASVSHVDADAA